MLKRFAGFNLTSLGSVLIQFLSLGLATHLLGNTVLVRQIALILTIVCLIVPYNWCVYNRLSWKKKPDPSAAKPPESR